MTAGLGKPGTRNSFPLLGGAGASLPEDTAPWRSHHVWGFPRAPLGEPHSCPHSSSSPHQRLFPSSLLSTSVHPMPEGPSCQSSPAFPLPSGLLALEQSLVSRYLRGYAESQTLCWAGGQRGRNTAAAVVSAVCNHLSFRPKCNCDGGRSCHLGPSDEGAAHFCRGQRSRGGGVFSGLEGSACPSTESFGKEMLGALCASYSSLPPSCRQRRSLAAQPVGSTWAMSCVQLALLLLSRHHNNDSGADPNP